MDWYYAVGKKKQGPMDDREFNSLISSGTITDKTLVWNNTMTDWTAYGTIKTQGHDKPEDDVPKVPKKVKSETTQKTCSECGKAFAQDELVSFNDSFICAGCKPAFVQKIREGIPIGEMIYGGFWIRLGAKIIDWIILMIVNYIISFAFGMLTPAVTSPEDINKIMIPSIIVGLLQWAVSLFYSIWFVGKHGATPGKMACGLKIVTAENEKVSYLRAFGRSLAEIISSIILCIGYIMAAFDSEKRTLHDRICSTRVIKNR
ncbi:MAG: RDD family protein [Desulfobacteraceae bacterium]|nr:RDD family protein [Desulfobacteraceae bacterium]